MAGLDHALYTLGSLDRLAAQRTGVHTLDPRAKIGVTLAYVGTVMSFGRYDISALLPLLFFPLWLAGRGQVPLRQIGVKLLVALPFVLCVGLFNPWLDTAPLLRLGNVDISGGWVSLASILLRFALTVSAAVVLIGVTGFATLCAALPRMGLPQAFAVQLLFLYRYIFVLIHEAARMQRARELRAFGRRGLGLSSCAPMLGQLLLRTVDRAQRIHQAMLCRGFDGTLPVGAPLHFSGRDWLFTLGWLAFFVLVRTVNVPLVLGQVLQRLSLSL